jgi:hypothetical protein
MRIGSAVSLCACAVPSVYAHAQCRELVRIGSAISLCACALSSDFAHVQYRQIFRMHSTVSLCALAVPMFLSSAVSLCARIHVIKIIDAPLFQVVLYHASSERQLLASSLHQNRYSAVFSCVSYPL